MDKIKSKIRKRIDLGKIDYYGIGRRINAVDVDIELRERGGEPTFTEDNHGNREYTGKKTPEYYELSISGRIWNATKTDCVCCGQNLDEIVRHIKTPQFMEIFYLWKKYHLNDMHPGTPEQEKAIDVWKRNGHEYDYTKACEYLKGLGLYEVPFYGKTIGRAYNGEIYTYGHGWVIEDIPDDVVAEIKAICQ